MTVLVRCRTHGSLFTMKFLQDCWIALLELLNLATFSTTGGPSLQQALQQPDHQFPLPDHASKPPIFLPPTHPEDPSKEIKCDYSAMGNQWVPCSSPKDRKCWLAGPAGDRFDINTDYEKRWPNGITRKVCETILSSYRMASVTETSLT